MTCNGNLLSYLNVKNGNNTNFTHLRANGNSNLYCVTVDDSNYSDTAWLNPLNTNFNFDTIVSFSNNCNPSASNKTYVPDDNFEAYLEANGMGDGIANNDSVNTSKIDTLLLL